MGRLQPDINSRLSMRERPNGSPIMHQSWDKLLFMHREIPVKVLRPLIPEPLTIDTFKGKAWVGLTPLKIYGLRPSFLPALPYLSELRELNVRTYVHLDGIPGVWFFSLDADNFPAVIGARIFFSLPYHSADISLKENGNEIRFSSFRADATGRFSASWKIGNEMSNATPDTLDFFLIERYCLYTEYKGKIYRCRIHHEPWPLQHTLGFSNYLSNMTEINGLPAMNDQPLLHCAGPVHVEIWPLEECN